MTHDAVQAGWYPDPADSNRVRYWDGKKWTETTQAAEITAKHGAAYRASDSDVGELRRLLHFERYFEEPDFVIWGTSDLFDKATSVSRKIAGMGREIFAFVAFQEFFLSTAGRLRSNNPNKLRADDSVRIAKIPYSSVTEINSTPIVGDALSDLVVHTPEKKGVLHEVLAGKGHRLHLTRHQKDSQAGLIAELTERIERAQSDTENRKEDNKDVVDKLSKLASMRDSGVLSGEEFESAKRKLLGN